MIHLTQNLEVQTRVQRRHQRGFGLLEVMITIGIIGIITAGLTQMLLNTNRTVMKTERTSEFNSMVNTMQGIFNNTGSCLAAMGGVKLNATITSAAPQQATMTVDGTTIQKGIKYGTSLKITKFEFTGKQAAGGVDQWIVPLDLSADRLVGGESNVSISHQFKLVVTLDATNKIVGCSGMYSDFWVTATAANDITYMNGNVGIGTNKPATKLDVNGTIQATAFLYSSDIRLKENIRVIPNALDRALKLQGVLFDWKDKKNMPNNKDHLGLIAQEVEKIFPEAVVTNPITGMKAVEYGNLIAPMIEALKEQQEIILKQEQDIDAIKKALIKNNIN